ncbi:hypothetical protein HGRIS_007020 [Hohenbuehelia grisea]|uniref:F-box domain-containing protein n=1 Tax=Hohenbuehelia grisea TaxID=104357 RepID=A0ABR3JCE6_9AGAR
MLYRRNNYSPNHKFPAETLSSNPNYPTQDGFASDSESGFSRLLLGIPEESLLDITTNLDPKSLLALGRVSRLLYEHVKDDNTWHRAFARQYLGIEPEHNLNNERKQLMMRQSSVSWRDAFIARFKLKRRWELSHNPMSTHSPLPDAPLRPIIHLPAASWPPSVGNSSYAPPPYVLLAVSPGGFVSRSFPLAGKSKVVSRIPDLMLSSNPCALSSDGSTGRALFGYPDGRLVVLSLSQFSSSLTERAVMPMRSNADDNHNGPVTVLQWTPLKPKALTKDRLIISGGADGRVKIWDFSRWFLSCILTFTHGPMESPQRVQAIGADLSSLHVVVAAYDNGEVVIWHDLEGMYPPYKPDAVSRRQISDAKKICIQPVLRPLNNQTTPEVSAIYVDDTSSPTELGILVVYQDQPAFLRIIVDLSTGSHDVVRYGSDPSLGVITSLEPYFAQRQGFVVAGDSLGCVSVYSLSATSRSQQSGPHDLGIVSPTIKFEAHEDASPITALAWNELVLATGTATGDVRVWDGLSLELIREFGPRQRKRNDIFAADGPEAHLQNRVGQILLGSEKDMLTFNVGARIVGWWAGKARKGGKGGVRGRTAHGLVGKKKDSGSGRVLGKGSQAYQLRRDIHESEDILQDSMPLPGTPERRAREHDQRSGLDTLGLSEAEAVEYVLMLSRDEHELQETSRLEYEFSAGPSTSNADLGVSDEEFDFDDAIQPSALHSPSTDDEDQTPSPTASTSSLGSLSAAFSGASMQMTPAQVGRAIPRTSSHSASSASLPASASSLGSLTAALSSASIHGGRSIPRTVPSASPAKVQVSPRFVPEPMEAGASYPAASGHGRSLGSSPVATGSISAAAHFPPMEVSVSPHARVGVPKPGQASVSPPASAWSTPLKVKAQGGTAEKGKAAQSATTVVPSPPRDEEMDEDLRFAIELSIAEARSREDAGVVD